MVNLNPFDEDTFKCAFTGTKIYANLIKVYPPNYLIWSKVHWSDTFSRKSVHVETATVRGWLNGRFSLTPFYYLQPLLDTDYDNIYDIGCGENMFKPYIPRLIGIGAEEKYIVHHYNKVRDPSWPYINNRTDFANLPARILQECVDVHGLCHDNVPFKGDVHGFVDKQYLDDHQDCYEAAFSICALHFRPIDHLQQIIEEFVSMIKPGGRGFLALNIQRMIDQSDHTIMIDLFQTTKPTRQQLETYIHEKISAVKTHWLIIDVDLTVIDEALNGNIRLVFEKQYG
jgi:hypothetical protein